MPCSMDRWKDKVAVVTGASAGMGAAIALELVKHGLKVVAIARGLERLQDVRKQAVGLGEYIPFKGDISKEEDIQAVFNFIKSKFGTVNILINNAGVYHPGKLSNQDPKLLREVLDVNVMGLTLCTQQALKLMKESGVDDGHIVNINAVDGHYVAIVGPEQITSMHTASKFAVTAITETLRQELVFFKSKIKVTSISPGYVATGIVEAAAAGAGGEQGKVILDIVDGLPSLSPQDIADGVVYVLSTPPSVQVHELTIRPVGEPF